MIIKNKKRIIFVFLILAMAIIVALFTFSNAVNKETVNKPNVIISVAELGYNPDDLESVVGNSENVFIGEVIEKTGEQGIDPQLPRTQYAVHIVKNIKGELPDTITVNQAMGYGETVDDNGNTVKALMKFEEQEFLQPGGMYVFSGLYSLEDNWVNITPVCGEKLINSAEKNENVAEYTEAFHNQKILDMNLSRDNKEDFIKGNNILN